MPHLPRKRTFCLPFVAIVLLVVATSATLAGDEAALELGKQVFTTIAAPKCSICHTLADAEAVGKIGPNLDDLKPTEDKVRLAVSGGVGSMPPYSETLSQEQIDAVALYVAKVTGAGE